MRVGNYTPIIWEVVPKNMDLFFEHLLTMTAFEAHNEFEKIHPYQDFNGRL